MRRNGLRTKRTISAPLPIKGCKCPVLTFGVTRLQGSTRRSFRRGIRALPHTLIRVSRVMRGGCERIADGSKWSR